MTLHKDNNAYGNEIRLFLDARKRVCLAKLLPDYDISSLKAHVEGDKIILEPMAEIPAHELWIYENPQILNDIREGLRDSKEGRVHKKGSFAKYADDDI